MRAPTSSKTRLMRAIFEQKVTGKEAYRGYAATVRAFADRYGVSSEELESLLDSAAERRAGRL